MTAEIRIEEAKLAAEAAALETLLMDKYGDRFRVNGYPGGMHFVGPTHNIQLIPEEDFPNYFVRRMQDVNNCPADVSEVQKRIEEAKAVYDLIECGGKKYFVAWMKS